MPLDMETKPNQYFILVNTSSLPLLQYYCILLLLLFITMLLLDRDLLLLLLGNNHAKIQRYIQTETK